jgi:pimeloyl-ACP methyl ester carboxylesterase
VIAPLLAAASADIAWIVLMAGPGVPSLRLLLDQAELIARAEGVPARARSASRRLNRAIYEVVMDEPDDGAARRRITELLEQHPETLGDASRDAVETLVAQVTSPWFRSFLAHDPRPILRGVRAPVLAINGELDLQVPPRPNLPAIAAALEAGGNSDYAAVKLPRLNHLFQTATTGSPSEYEAIAETLAPAALAVIGEWIARR